MPLPENNVGPVLRIEYSEGGIDYQTNLSDAQVVYYLEILKNRIINKTV